MKIKLVNASLLILINMEILQDKYLKIVYIFQYVIIFGIIKVNQILIQQWEEDKLKFNKQKIIYKDRFENILINLYEFNL